MSKMSELYVEVTEMLEQGYSHDVVTKVLVEAGVPAGSCPGVIQLIVNQINARKRANG